VGVGTVQGGASQGVVAGERGNGKGKWTPKSGGIHRGQRETTHRTHRLPSHSRSPRAYALLSPRSAFNCTHRQLSVPPLSSPSPCRTVRYLCSHCPVHSLAPTAPASALPALFLAMSAVAGGSGSPGTGPGMHSLDDARQVRVRGPFAPAVCPHLPAPIQTLSPPFSPLLLFPPPHQPPSALAPAQSKPSPWRLVRLMGCRARGYMRRLPGAPARRQSQNVASRRARSILQHALACSTAPACTLVPRACTRCTCSGCCTARARH